MAEADPREFIRMTHSAVKAPSGLVTRKAFEQIHKAKGWKEASAEDAAAAEARENGLAVPAAARPSTAPPAK